jgi:4-amino-4-deoxy-L-arabinose transferase-like glycosyltransferase
VFSLAARFFDGNTAGLSLILLWGTATIILVAITPRVDVTVGLYAFLAHHALLLARQSPHSRRWAGLGAALLGFAFGVKYHGALYALALSPLFLAVAFGTSKRPGDARRLLLAAALLAVVTAAPWLLKNWLLLRAPLYPFLSEPQLPPWLGRLTGAATIPAAVEPETFQLIWGLRQPFSFSDAFFAPGNISIEYEGAYYHTSPALLLLPLWIFFVRNRTLNWLLLPALLYLAALLVPFPRTNLRYLIPAVPALTVAVAAMLAGIGARFLSRDATLLLAAVVAALSLISAGRAAQVRFSGTRALAHFAGRVSTDTFLQTHYLPEVNRYAPLVKAVNNRLSTGDRILMLFEGRGYYFIPTTIQDNKATNWPLLAETLGTDDCLENRGITHVLLGIDALRYYRKGGMDLERVRWEAFQQFAARCLTPVVQGPGHVLYEVKRPAG